MPILRKEDSKKGDFAPGIERTEIVNGSFGSDSLTVADLDLEDGSQVPTHFHPKEEAMYILEGELVSLLADEQVTVTAGDTVLAPAGIKHGFTNKSGKPARLLANHPTAKVEVHKTD
mgnify:FL=1